MFTSGNAESEGKDHRGWFVGHFMDQAPQKRKDIEIKWSHHPQGDGDPEFDSQKFAKSISILIFGKIEYSFRKGDKVESVVVDMPGDYVMWSQGQVTLGGFSKTPYH